MKKLHILALATAFAVALPLTPVSAAAERTQAREPSPCAATGTSKPADTPASAERDAPRVWLAGDSTMAEPADGTVCPVGWGSQFAPFFTGGVVVDNQAVAGRSIQSWLYEKSVTGSLGTNGECELSDQRFAERWQAMLDRRTGIQRGDYLIVQFGINDGDASCPRHVGPGRYQQLMTMMAQSAVGRGAHPVLLTAVAAISCEGDLAVRNRGFVEQTYAAGRKAGAPVIDLQSLSVGLYNQRGFCPTDGDYRDCTAGSFFCDDRNHFEVYGARQVAALVAGALRDQHIPLAAYLR